MAENLFAPLSMSASTYSVATAESSRLSFVTLWKREHLPSRLLLFRSKASFLLTSCSATSPAIFFRASVLWSNRAVRVQEGYQDDDEEDGFVITGFEDRFEVE